MNDFPLSFTIGLICTAALFALCFLTVIGTKTALLAIKKYLPEKPKPSPPPAPLAKKRKPRTVKTPSAIRSIEIDPKEVDRIYVKKSG